MLQFRRIARASVPLLAWLPACEDRHEREPELVAIAGAGGAFPGEAGASGATEGGAVASEGAAGSDAGGAAPAVDTDRGGAAGEAASSGGALPSSGGEGAGGAACELEYSEGHGDLFLSWEQQLEVRVRSTFGAAPPEILAETSRVCVVVPAASRDLVTAMGGAPKSDDYAFLGVASGESFWLLPQAPRDGMPWFGASTEKIPAGYFDDDAVRVAVAALEMPPGGQLSAWSTSTFGAPSVLLSTATNVLTHVLPVGAHLHFNWGFSAPGIYTVALSVQGERDGVTTSSPASPLRFVVQP